MSREVCGICWCPYDEVGKCGCPEFSQPSGAISSTAMLREAAQQALEALLGQRGEPDWHTGKQRETAIAALSAALAEPICKQSLQVAEQQGPEHISSPECWCHPELDYKDPETGAEVWVHRSMQ